MTVGKNFQDSLKVPENSKPVIRVPTVGACQNLNFRLYVKE
jgi:hypothetical protein